MAFSVTFLRNLNKTHLVLALLVLAATFSLLGKGAAAWLRNSVQWALVAGGDAGMYLTTALKSSTGKPRRLTPAEVETLQSELEHYRSLAQRNYRTYKELHQKFVARRRLYAALQRLHFPCELIEGRVIGADSLPYASGRSINLGRRQGAVPGAHVTTSVLLTPARKALPDNLPVLVDQQALVGRIVEAWAFGARVQLITDRGFRLAAQVHRIYDKDNPRPITSLQQGNVRRTFLRPDSSLVDVFVTGDGAGGLEVKHVPREHNIQPGDEILTRDDGRFLPAGVRIARIVRCQPEAQNPGMVTLCAEPLVDLSSLRNVFLVVPLGTGHGEE